MKKTKWIDENLFKIRDKLDEFISKKLHLYKNSFNIVSPVLGRNVKSSNLFKYFCNYEFDKRLPKKITFINKVKKIMIYYFRSIIHFMFILIHGVIYKLSYNKSKPSPNKKIYLIDTFTMIEKIYPNGFNDNYFQNMYDVLKKNNLNFAILSILFGDKPYNLKKRYKIYKLLENNENLFLSEFEFLKIIDYLKLFYFILIYPLYHLKTKSKNNTEYDYIYNVVIDETLDMPQLYNYVRYLFGQRLREYFKEEIIVITWDENQVIHKLLNKGIKNDKTTIIGTKFFGILYNWIHCRNLEIEYRMGVSPDKILLKGDVYKNYFNELPTDIGFATRETYLYNIKLQKLKKHNNLNVVLGYDIEENKKLINAVTIIENDFNLIFIRLHPNHRLNTPFDIPSHWKISNGDMIEFVNKADVIISVGTGAALEIMCMGKFVILMGGNKEATTNPLPIEYKNYNWNIFYEIDELKGIIKKEKQLKNIDLEYFFKKATEEQIIKSLGL